MNQSWNFQRDAEARIKEHPVFFWGGGGGGVWGTPQSVVRYQQLPFVRIL